MRNKIVEYFIEDEEVFSFSKKVFDVQRLSKRMKADVRRWVEEAVDDCLFHETCFLDKRYQDICWLEVGDKIVDIDFLWQEITSRILEAEYEMSKEVIENENNI